MLASIPYTQIEMALPPSIPTSFVPRPSSAAVRRRTDLTGAFAFFGYGVLALAIGLAIAVFIYNSILSAQLASKDAELAKAVAAIDSSTVSNFVHLRDRLSSGENLLTKHRALSHFFSTFGSLMPAGTRLSALHVSATDAGLVTIEATGVAKSFNALAASSNSFASDGRIKDAIFSGIRVQNNAVSFTLSATIDPSLIAFTAEGLTPPEGTASTTTP